MQVSKRPEGFTGQRMAVLPRDIAVAASRHPLLRGLLPTDAGYFPKASGHDVSRPKGISEWIIILCLNGTGWVRGENEQLAIEAGDLLSIAPKIPHHYGADEEAPWDITWVHAAGEEIGAWQAYLKVGRPMAKIALAPAAAYLDEHLANVWKTLEKGYTEQHLVAASTALRSFLSVAGESLRAPNRSDHATAIARTVDWIRQHPGEKPSLSQLARLAGYSIPHYTALFRSQTGYTPVDFFIRTKIQYACRLLNTSRLPISEIAEQLGYEDPFYFTRSFRKIMGESPRAYQRRFRG